MPATNQILNPKKSDNQRVLPKNQNELLNYKVWGWSPKPSKLCLGKFPSLNTSVQYYSSTEDLLTLYQDNLNRYYSND